MVSLSGDPCLEELPRTTDPRGSGWSSWLATSALGRRNAIATVVAGPISDTTPESLEMSWTVTVVVEAPPAGLDENWLKRMESSR